MFFRNLTLFRIFPDTAEDLARLAEVLPEMPLRECGPQEMFTTGFVPPISLEDDGALTHDVEPCALFAFGKNERMLPGNVVNAELRKRLKKITAEEDRKVGGRERKRIKEELINELLGRAFIRSTRTLAYADKGAGWLVIDSSSRKQAEDLITAVRLALGSFPAIPLAPREDPRVLLTHWLSNGLPPGLALGDECELRDPATADGAIARCSKQDLQTEEVAEHLRNGKRVYKLALVFEDRISFVLGADLVVRKLKFLDVVTDQIGDHEDNQREANAAFCLMTLELGRLLDRLAQWFGLRIDAPLHLHGQAAPVGMRRAAAALERLAEMDGARVTIETGDGSVLASFGKPRGSLGDHHSAGGFGK